MTGGIKTPYKLKKNYIFQLPDCVSEYNLLLPPSMEMLKGKTAHNIDGLIVVL